MPFPKRAETVHVEQLGDELCLYNWQRNEVHALNPTAARVWQLCDGQTSPVQIAAQLQAELNVSNAEELVWLTLSQLETAHLLAAPVASLAKRKLLPRREFIRLGIAAALLPAVYSIVAPPPVAAQSPVPTNTAVPTATNAATATATATASTVPTATATALNAPTATATALNAPTVTVTETPTVTATASNTSTPTVTETPTASTTPTVTVTIGLPGAQP